MSYDTHSRDTLSTAHWQHLTIGSAIAADIVLERGYRTIESKYQWKQIDYKLADKQIRTPGIGFPVYRLGKPEPYAWILRPDNPRVHQKDGREKSIKYEWPTNVSPCLDVLPSYRDEIANPATPLWITEGAKKADALATAFNTTIVPVNLNGVWGWRGKNTAGGKVALPDLEEIALNDRLIVLAFDSDVVRNRQVLMALQRLAHLLKARGAAEIRTLVLPQDGEDKIGVDDALAQGWTPEQFKAHLIPLSEALGLGREKLFAHPETKQILYLPPGYLNSGESIARVDRGDPYVVYSGLLAIEASGVDLQSNVETLTVRFDGRFGQRVEVTAPRSDLSRGKGVIEYLGARGAAVHEGNARDVARYLIEFAHENRDALPHRQHTNRLGLFNTGLVLPAGSVGFDQDVRYIGKHSIRVGTDREAYKRVFAEALTWQDPWTFLAVVGLSLASPAIARIKPRRNPSVYLAGSSNSGKTTTAQFAAGVWGDPTRAPLRLEAGRTTRAGMMQTLEELSGLPLFIDEAHTTRDPRDLEATVYQFANGEAYTRGGADGKTRGGEPLGGSLILAGEALPEFKHAGSHNRIMWLDVGQCAPLGCEPRSLEGARRAELLEHAWLNGAGLLGLDVARAMWNDWTSFTTQINNLQSHWVAKDIQAWKPALVMASAALVMALDILDIPVPNSFRHLLERWNDMLSSGQQQSDPASEAWEQLVTMLVQSDEVEEGNWIVSKLQYQIVACRKKDEDAWRVLTNTPQFKDRVGASAVQLHGRTWLQRGWIQPHDKGETTGVKAVPGHKTQRVLLVPATQIELSDLEV